MAATARLTLSGTIEGLPDGQDVIQPVQIASTNASGERYYPIDLSTGNNNFGPLSSTAKLLIFTPPAGNAVAMTLKGSSADTGIPMLLDEPTILTFKATSFPAIIITAAGPVVGCSLRFI